MENLTTDMVEPKGHHHMMALRRRFLIAIAAVCLAASGCYSRSKESATFVLTNECIDGWYVLAEDVPDGSDPVVSGKETIITFGADRVAKVKGRPFSGRWLTYQFINNKANQVIRDISASPANSRSATIVAHRHDKTIWFYIGNPPEPKEGKGSTVRLSEFTFTLP